MAMTFVWGFLPVFVKEKEGGWGSARGISIKIPKSSGIGSPLYYHELFHVKQFYAYVGLIFLILSLSYVLYFGIIMLTIPLVASYLTNWGRARREIAAYGESVRQEVKKGKDSATMIKHYANIFNDSDSHYEENLSLDEIESMMTRRYKDSRLF